MDIIFNIGVILFVILIAYWWANQGVLSALLHLLAVIAAGAIAFGLWEYAAFAMIRGTGFDGFAWGVSLVLLFAISLVILRLITDKTIRANITLPQWANMIFGGGLGLGAGILTMGILLIGAGFLQSHKEIMGYQAYGRGRDGRVVDGRLSPMWLPVEELTAKFYSFLSVGALYPDFERRPMAHYSPQLHRQASLVRDSYDDGQGQLAMQPKAVRIKAAYWDQGSPIYRLHVSFGREARDFNEQLTLSQAQVRLIEYKSSGAGGEARVVHPLRWAQATGQVPGEFSFEDITHYVTSVAGKESADVVFEFRLPPSFIPRFLQVRNTRVEVPQTPQPGGTAIGPGMLSALLSQSGGAVIALNPLAPNIGPAIEVTDSLRGLRLSVNTLSGSLSTVEVDNKYFLDSGFGEIGKSDTSISRALRIDRIYAPKGTVIVQVNVSRNSPANLFGEIRDQTAGDDEMALVDQLGGAYRPIGYIYVRPDLTEVNIDRGGGLSELSALPPIPTTGGNTMYLLFTVTEGATIAGLQCGEITVGTSNVRAVPPR